MDTTGLPQLRAENEALRLRVEALEAERAEQARRATEGGEVLGRLARMQRVLGELPLLVDIFDLPAKRSVFKNRDLDALLGYPPGALAAMGPQPVLYKIVHPDDIPRLVAFLDGVLSSNAVVETASVEYRFRRGDGALGWFRSQVREFDRGSDGRLLTVLMVTYDITETKVAEEALRALNAALSSPVIRIRDDALVVPVIGAVDADRAAIMSEVVLGSIVRLRARFLVLDLTGLQAMDATTAAHIQRLVEAACLLGSEVVLCGISPAIAALMIEREITTSAATVKNLRQALRRCARRRRAWG